MQVGAVFLPLPYVWSGLHLVDGDAAGGELARAFAAGLAEPWTLGRRIRLRTHPHVMLARLGVDLLHQLARLVGEPAGSGSLHCHGSHDVFSCRSRNSTTFAANMPNGRCFFQGRLVRREYSCPGKFATSPLDQGQCRCNFCGQLPLRKSATIWLKASGRSMLEMCPAPGNSA